MEVGGETSESTGPHAVGASTLADSPRTMASRQAVCEPLI